MWGIKLLAAVLIFISVSHFITRTVSPTRPSQDNIPPSSTEKYRRPSVLDRISSLFQMPQTRTFRAHLTSYYTPLPGQRKYYSGSYAEDLRINGTGTTFSGKVAKIGHVAADLSHHPLGTKLRIPGYDIANEFGIVEDKGSAIRGPHRLDLYMGRGEEGLRRVYEWERKRRTRVTVEIINPAR